MANITGHWWLILLLLVIVLIIWGPGKLPDVGSGMGRAIREFRKASSETRDTIINATATPPAEQAAQAAQPAAAPGATPVEPVPTPAAAGPREEQKS